MAGNLLYVNARIKSLENGLLSTVQLNRLLEADNLKDLFKILQECGYGSGLTIEDTKSVENLLAVRETDAIEFLRENLFKNSGLEIFLFKNDYHNAKVIMKAKYLRLKKMDEMLVTNGMYDVESMKEDILNDDYENLSKRMAEALGAIDVAFVNGNRSPRLIDIILDKAMYHHLMCVAKDSKQKPLIDYLAQKIDLTNISSFIRCKNLNLDESYFFEMFIQQGTINEITFKQYFEMTMEQFKEKMKFTPYFDIVSKAYDNENGMVLFETASANFLLNKFKENKYDMFSVAPIAGFYLAQITELQTIKLIISCVKNNVDKKYLKQRLRDLYA